MYMHIAHNKDNGQKNASIKQLTHNSKLDNSDLLIFTDNLSVSNAIYKKTKNIKNTIII